MTFSIHGADTNDISACERKTRYRSKQLAKDAAARSSRRGPKITVYECRLCHGHHLTSADPATDRARRRR